MRRIKNHTAEKLTYIKKYINAYLKATKSLPSKYYVDGFSGTGKCIICNKKCKSVGGLKCCNCGKGSITDGSSLIALHAAGDFTKYLFVEINDKNIKELEQTISREIDSDKIKKIIFKNEDANLFLQNLYKYIPDNAGCLVLLDPEGSELSWETIKSLSKIKKIDLLILYAYDMALVRLTKNYTDKLDKFYGTSEWQKIFNDNQIALERKNKLLNFYKGRLMGLGFKYVEWRQIRRRLREGKSLYHLILATRHPVAAKIMADIFNKELDGQQKIKFGKKVF